MKVILPLLFVVALYACHPYQVLTVASPAARPNEDHELVIENDSLVFTYRFNGVNGPVQVRILNKLQQPVFVDWNRSALIVKGQAITYSPNSVGFSASMPGGASRWNRQWTSGAGQIQGHAQLPAELDFIPPQTAITKQLIGITNRPLLNLPDSAFIWVKAKAGGYRGDHIYLADFTAANSPLAFTSYVTLLAADSSTRPVVFQHPFFIAEVAKKVHSLKNERADRFHVQENYIAYLDSTGYGIINGKALWLDPSVGKRAGGVRR